MGEKDGELCWRWDEYDENDDGEEDEDEDGNERKKEKRKWVAYLATELNHNS